MQLSSNVVDSKFGAVASVDLAATHSEACRVRVLTSLILWFIPVAFKDVSDPTSRTAAISLRRK